MEPIRSEQLRLTPLARSRETRLARQLSSSYRLREKGRKKK